MPSLISPAPPRTTGVGERVQLASYTAAGQTRVLYSQRIDGVVRLNDHPANDAPGRRYVIERGLEQDGYAALLALVDGYVDQAAKHDCIPTLRWSLSSPDGSL